MAREIVEAPAAVRLFLDDANTIDAIAAELNKRPPALAIVCGRGSSGHAGVFLRYLIETRLNIPVSAAAPSIATSFARTLSLPNALFVVITQSGRSPDLIEATRAARKGGARTIAIVNDAKSPAAAECEFVLPIKAGPERSVAATKTVIGSMAAAALLTAALADDMELRAAVQRLPDRLAAALRLDWDALALDLRNAPAAFVAARGLGLGTAREIALKMAEALRLPALAYSAAEFLHGPRAAVTRATPVLALRLDDETSAAVDRLVLDLKQAADPVYVAGGPSSQLAWIGDDHPATDAITLLAPAYRMIERAAAMRGIDPDRPAHLQKITETI